MEKTRLRVLRRFLSAYVIADDARAHPRRDLRRVTTPELWRGLRQTDRAALTHALVRHVERTMGGAYAAEYLVMLDSGDRLLVDLALNPDGWRVCDVEPGQEP